MKKLLMGFITFVFVFSFGSVYAQDFNVIVGSKEANAGDIVEIDVTFENNSGLVAALFELEYDKERLKLSNVSDGGILEGATFSPNYMTYPYKMVWNSASYENFTEDGVLVTLEFEVLSGAISGDAFVNLTYSENDVFDVDLNNVTLNINNGVIKVSGKQQSTPSSGSSSGTRRPSAGSAISKPTNNTVKEEPKEQMILTIGKKEALVFGETKINDVAPKLVNDRTMLPIRFIAEALGAEVDWNGTERKVTIIKDDIKIIITITSDKAIVNEKTVILDSPAFIENDRTYLPLRFISENLGATVEWVENTQQVIITK